MRDKDRRTLDDLNVGESELTIDCGSVLVKGTYTGLKRTSCGKWGVEVLEPKSRFPTFVPVSDIVRFAKVVK